MSLTRTPEKSSVDAELIAVYALSVYDVARAVGCKLCDIALSISDIELVAGYESRGA